MDRLHVGAERDLLAADRARQALRELVHAADRLEDRRGLRTVCQRHRAETVADAGLQQCVVS